MTAQSVLRLNAATSVTTTAEILQLDGVDILHSSENEIEKVRGKSAGRVFQDPLTCLNPTMKVGAQITEALYRRNKMSAAQCREEAVRLLGLVQIADAQMRANQYPHQFSGGMRQRIMIAILLITHDFGVVANLADRVAVMYAGRIVEVGEAKTIYENPLHPYTKMLLESVLVPLPDKERLENEVPMMGETEGKDMQREGCPFAKRCPKVQEICGNKNPILSEIKQEHLVACHGIILIEE